MVGGKELAVTGCGVGGRQKKGSPGYCCSVGGYQQPGSPLCSWHCRWVEGAMDGTTFLSLQLILHTSFLWLLSSLLFFHTFPPTQSFTCLTTSVPSPSVLSAQFILWAFHSLSPTLTPYGLVLNGGFRTLQLSAETPFLFHARLSTYLYETPELLYLSLSYFSPLPAFFSPWTLPHSSFKPRYKCNILNFGSRLVLALSPLATALCIIVLFPFSLIFAFLSLLLGLCVCGQLFLVLHSWCQIG